MFAKLTRGLAATALASVAAVGSAQTLADLRNDATTPGDVTTYGMGWSQQRHSPLKQIDPGNAARLQAVWNLSLDNSANASSQPLVIGGTDRQHFGSNLRSATNGASPGSRRPIPASGHDLGV